MKCSHICNIADDMAFLIWCLNFHTHTKKTCLAELLILLFGLNSKPIRSDDTHFFIKIFLWWFNILKMPLKIKVLFFSVFFNLIFPSFIIWGYMPKLLYTYLKNTLRRFLTVFYTNKKIKISNYSHCWMWNILKFAVWF